MNDELLVQLEALKGKQVTLFQFSEMGFPSKIFTRITAVYKKKYAQYDYDGGLIHIQHKPKGRRNELVNRIYPHSQMLIFAGWIELNADMYVKTQKCGGGYSLSESLSSFDDEYFNRALASTKEKPIITINPKLHEQH